MWREFSLVNSYTCEASFCGPSQGMYKGLHFNIAMLLEMGRDFCRTLAVYSEQDQSYYYTILSELQYMHESSAPAVPPEHQVTAVSNKNGKVAQLTDTF